MPRILRGLKSIFSEPQPTVVVEETSISRQIMSLMEQHLPSNLISDASKLYSKALDQLTTLTQGKSQAELLFMASILAAVLLFAVVLPLHEAFSRKSLATDKRCTISPSSNSSATDSLETIEESEEEDLPDPIEVVESLKFVDEEDEAIQVYDDQPFVSIANKDVMDEEDKQSDATPVTVDEKETPTSSPCVTPLRVKPTLSKDYMSVPNVLDGAQSSKRSSFSKMKKMTSSLSFRRKDSTDASVTSTSSNRSFRVFSIKNKKD
ncbi:hypothetical protein ACHAWO_012240 [Cyclotella atomus]|uniref:Uncharacterized protein n=1 Tax=Cyclotella atomus TaxID=382360 RepID=A0ABD3MTF8_9STRA